MFKKIATFAVAALLTLSASSAFAYTADSELFRVVFSTGAGATTTVVNDLGSISSILAKTGSSSIAGTSFSYSTLGASANSSNTFVTYFAKDNAVATPGSYSVWTAYDAALAAPVSGNRKYANTNSGITGFANFYTVANTTGTLADYQSKMGLTGQVGGFLATGLTAEYSLASLTTLNLYKFTGSNPTTFPVTTGVNALSGLTITTLADGSTQVNGPAGSSPVPLPAAFYLMGSGLLGLVGMRRRNKA
jgi:hypothetical protein